VFEGFDESADLSYVTDEQGIVRELRHRPPLTVDAATPTLVARTLPSSARDSESLRSNLSELPSRRPRI
jgi:hypothetical protein